MSTPRNYASVATSTLVAHDPKDPYRVLMTRKQGLLRLPGGIVDFGKDRDGFATGGRELFEETECAFTGLDSVSLIAVGSDHGGDERVWNDVPTVHDFDLVFAGPVSGGLVSRDPDEEIAEVFWYNLRDAAEPLEWTRHAEYLRCWLRRIHLGSALGVVDVSGYQSRFVTPRRPGRNEHYGFGVPSRDLVLLVHLESQPNKIVLFGSEEGLRLPSFRQTFPGDQETSSSAETLARLSVSHGIPQSALDARWFFTADHRFVPLEEKWFGNPVYYCASIWSVALTALELRELHKSKGGCAVVLSTSDALAMQLSDGHRSALSAWNDQLNGKFPSFGIRR